MTEYERLGEVLDTLTECAEFLDNYVDVVDGDYGEPAPNKAMRVRSHVEDSISHVISVRLFFLQQVYGK